MKKAKGKIKIVKSQPAAKTAVKKPFYSITIKLSAQKLIVASAPTIVQCLNKIKIELIKSKVILKVIGNNKTKEIIMRPFELKQLLTKPMNKDLFQKRMLLVLQ